MSNVTHKFGAILLIYDALALPHVIEPEPFGANCAKSKMKKD